LHVEFAKSSLPRIFLDFCLMSEENYGFRVIPRSTLNNSIASQSQHSFNNGYFFFANKGLQPNWNILYRNSKSAANKILPELAGTANYIT